MHVARGDSSNVHDGRITEGAVVALDGSAANQNSFHVSFLGRSGGNVEHQVLVALAFKRSNGVVQAVQVVAEYTQNHAELGGQSVHVVQVVSLSAIQDGLASCANFQSSASSIGAAAVQDQGAAGLGSLLHQFYVSILVAFELKGQGLNVHTLGNTIVVNVFDGSPLLVEVSSGHGNGEQVARNERLLVTIQNGFAAHAVLFSTSTNFDGLHGRSSCLGELSQSFSRHMGAFVQANSTLGNLHSERHASGVAAFLAVSLRSQFEDIKTFESHGIPPTS